MNNHRVAMHDCSRWSQPTVSSRKGTPVASATNETNAAISTVALATMVVSYTSSVG